MNHHGKCLSIYDIPKTIAKISYFDSDFTGKNIKNGFSKQGSWPFNKLVFSEECLIRSDVYAGSHETTEDASETTEGSISTLNNRKELTPLKTVNICLPSTSKDTNPDSLRPFPKIFTETKKRK